MLGTCERTVSYRMTAASPAATASPRRSCRGRHCRLGLGASCAGSRPQPCRVPVAPGRYAGAGRRPVPPVRRGELRPRDPWPADCEKMVAWATQLRAGRRTAAGRAPAGSDRSRVPRLADPGHGPARRNPQLPAAATRQAGPWSPLSRAATEQAMRFRRRALRPRTPGSSPPSSCAAAINATPCATWTNVRLRPGSPSSCRRTGGCRPG